MEPNTGKAERIVRTGLGLMITAVGIYTLFVSLWLGAFIFAVGAFTVYEGVSGWTFLRAFWGTSSVPGSPAAASVVDDLLSDFSYYGDDK